MIATDQLCGVLVLDKPAGWTSHDAVNKVRRLAKTKKTGHLGTLDPLATGVLPLVIGKATRLAQYFAKDRKSYEARIRFGHSTFSYDRDGEATSEHRVVELEAKRIEELLERYRGSYLQTPPPVSAKKIEGVPAYKLARQDKPVELTPVPVHVFALETLAIEGADLVVRVDCSAGTYIRAIAHELGKDYGCGAFVEALRRTRSGDFLLEQARTMDEVAEACAQDRFAECLVPGPQLLPQFPVEIVDSLTEAQIRQGREFRTSPFRTQRDAPMVKAVNRSGQLIAIGERKLPNLYHPTLVIG